MREGEEAAIIGYPIFVGLNVGSEGVVFKCLTVNVKNEDDEALLGFLESGVQDRTYAGNNRAASNRPALRNGSRPNKEHRRTAQECAGAGFLHGLDFTEIAFRARLAEGSYLAVQIPEA